MSKNSTDHVASVRQSRLRLVGTAPPPMVDRHQSFDEPHRPAAPVIGLPPPSITAAATELYLSSAVEHPADATPRPISPDECWEDDNEPPRDRPERLILDMVPDDDAPPRDADPPPSWYEPPADWEPRPDRPEDELWPEPSSDEAPRDPSAAAAASSSPSQPMQIELSTYKEEYERRVREGLLNERVKREITRYLDAEAHGATVLPEFMSLRDRLAQPREPIHWRVEGWQPYGSRVSLVAQYKAGKTTFVGNWVRSLVDVDLWLGQFLVTPVDGRVALLDDEMSDWQLDEWLRDQKIKNDDRITVMSLRGKVATFNILDPTVRAEWAARLRALNIKYLILDCLRPVLDALGLNENHDAGRFLIAFDALMLEADIPEALVVQHMGHENERARGDSRLRDWPEAEWLLIRKGNDPASPRFIRAYGRDVDVPETALTYDASTRRYTLGAGSREDEEVRKDLAEVVAFLETQTTVLSGRKVKEGMKAAGSRLGAKKIDAALELGVSTGEIIDEGGPGKDGGPNKVHCYRVPTPQGAG